MINDDLLLSSANGNPFADIEPWELVVAMSMDPYIQKFDAVPEFWQFFNSLNSDDLIIELIQNELDANATNTRIAFQSDKLVCQGDGEPVTEDGWERLSYVKGAGDLVPSKQFRIGIKNHGLKACFALGDDIILRSGGRLIKQTLYQNGKHAAPSPAAYSHPVPDNEAPANGCMVEVPYRTKPLRVTVGEPFERAPVDNGLVERLFFDACEQLPERLMGVVSPKVQSHYGLIISHHTLGSVEFCWTAKRGTNQKTKRGKRLTAFGRVCAIASGCSQVESREIYERACEFRLNFPSGTRSVVANHFEPDRKSFKAEVAWRVDKTNRPLTSAGLRRYPIGYDRNSAEAYTGLGVNFSGPYRSDAARHGISKEDALNEYIDRACRDVLLDALVSYVVPRHGAKALELFVTPARPNEQALSEIVDLAITKSAIPLQSGSRTHRLRENSKGGSGNAVGLAFGPRRMSGSGSKRIVIPSFDTDYPVFSSALSQICPGDQDQINADVPSAVLRCLADDRFGDRVAVFSGEDALLRLQPRQGGGSFPWKSETEWKRVLGDPLTAKKHLNAVRTAIEEWEVLPRAGFPVYVHLPDAECKARPLSAMYSASVVPPSLKNRYHVPLLHPSLLEHPLLKQRPWKPYEFEMVDYLGEADLDSASFEDRVAFWRWLRVNWKVLKSDDRDEIAALPVWPGMSGDLRRFEDLCEPTKSRVASTFGDAIERPSRDIFKFGLARESGRGKFSIRKLPTMDEFEDFLSAHLGEFPTDRRLDADERRAFRSLEKDLVALASVPELKGYLTKIAEKALTLNGDGYLKAPRALVRDEENVSLLCLPRAHVIDRPNRALDLVPGWSPKPNPSASQIEDALRTDPGRCNAHIPRIQAYVKQARIEGIPPEKIKDVPCIPVSGKPYAPSQLAMHGKVDYWGGWKTFLRVRDVNPEVQRLYKAIGVTGGSPTVEDSRLFFQWLNDCGQRTVADHVDQVLHHIAHKYGPRSWPADYSAIPFIPVECGTQEVRLATISEATNRSRPVVIPDFETLEVKIRQHLGTQPVYLAVVESPRLNENITAELRNFGLRTLRDLAGEPEPVSGSDVNAEMTTGHFEQVITSLRSGAIARQLRKRLDELGLDKRQKNLKNRWHDRLSAINHVRIADSVIATYKISRQTFDVSEVGKFDKGSGTLWLQSGSDMEENFYDAVAELVFTDPKKYLGSVLRRAYEMELRNRNPDFLSKNVGPPDEFENYEYIEQDDDIEELAATSGVHPVPTKDPLKNLPNPGPIPASPKRSGGLTNQRRRVPRRTQPTDEAHQINDLKVNQYAWHCQACLASVEPNKLAPEGSYVAWHQNRVPFMQAHHCDHVDARGARHVGNILLLCRYHHLDIGDAITRKDVIDRFGEATDRSIIFVAEDGTLAPVAGKRLEISPPQRSASVTLFFTNAHFKFWRDSAKADRLV